MPPRADTANRLRERPVRCSAGAAERANLIGFARPRLESFFESLGERPFRARQVLKWVHARGASEFEPMTDLGRSLRARLGEVAEIRAPEVEDHRVSADGTRKWLLRVDSGNCVEMVFIPEGHRGTLCVSSQVGCPLDCAFCSTAQQGFNRNLTAAEIAGQVWLAVRALDRPVTNVVLMGMGEPLLNFDAVTEAIDLMLEDLAYGLARRRVTLSTAGLVPGIDRLAHRAPVSLAVSLHAPDDALRDRLVPLNRKYPIAELLAACRRFAAVNPKQKITFEYVMLDGVNDSPAHARALIERLGTVPAKVNLIPFNPFPGAPFRRSPQAVIDAFRERLNGAGIVAITRRPRGDDIDAACGQLAGEVVARAARGRRSALAAMQ
ncbi:MAG: 23S rRNA (adenine(2503)-C(2))-methyltransferase RlmN [Immundisolibacterales bacterium]|nr:23S rRNA (adenine(2503)-C(2))-methyltransferase RlmN [Immundisolibacterales bacterium]